MSMVLSARKVRQWSIIRRIPAYSVACRMCTWKHEATERHRAEGLFRLHVKDSHVEANL